MIRNSKEALQYANSKRVKDGTVIMTRDEFFEDHNGYVKEKYKGTNTLYRECFSVASNDDGEMALIKTQSNGRESVENKSKQVEKYNPYLKIKDNEGKPIVLGEKFARGPSQYDVSASSAYRMKMKAINHRNATIRNDNRQKINHIKKRKP